MQNRSKSCNAPDFSFREKIQSIRAPLLAVLVLVAAEAWGGPENEMLGLPARQFVPTTQQSPRLSALGQKIFFDKRFSADGSISCATCHQPEHAFSDNRPLARGIGSAVGTRNTPSLLNAAFNASQFWDGRRETLESQAVDPFLNPQEHGLADDDSLLSLLRNDPGYAQRFHSILGLRPQQIKVKHVALALASFERSLVSGNSPFDRYYFVGEKAKLSLSAVRGMALFMGTARCASCHVVGEKSALFTDNEYHSLSVGLTSIAQRLPAITTQLVHMKAAGESFDQAVLSNRDVAELGRFGVTFNPADIGKFRTPSLRNVELTAPYMHDGSVATLEQAVELEIYYRSAETGFPLILTPVEKTDLVEFLKSLTSPSATAANSTGEFTPTSH